MKTNLSNDIVVIARTPIDIWQFFDTVLIKVHYYDSANLLFNTKKKWRKMNEIRRNENEQNKKKEKKRKENEKIKFPCVWKKNERNKKWMKLEIYETEQNKEESERKQKREKDQFYLCVKE